MNEYEKKEAELELLKCTACDGKGYGFDKNNPDNQWECLRCNGTGIHYDDEKKCPHGHVYICSECNADYSRTGKKIMES